MKIDPFPYIRYEDYPGVSSNYTNSIKDLNSVIYVPPTNASKIEVQCHITNSCSPIGGGSIYNGEDDQTLILTPNSSTQLWYYLQNSGAGPYNLVCTVSWNNNAVSIKYDSKSNVSDSCSLSMYLKSSVLASDDFKPKTDYYTTYQFKDGEQVKYDQFTTATDNTQLKPKQVIIPSSTPVEDVFNNAYNLSLYYHSPITTDKLQLYSTQHNKKVEQYSCDLIYATIPAQILSAPIYQAVGYNNSNFVANPNLYLLYSIAREVLQDNNKYYNYLQQHDECWQTLYRKYPGIFRESNYENSTAINSQELYQAAKAQLDSVCKPAYEYSLTGMDIYMHDSDYVPTRIKLGEQIRIDYQEKDQLTDTLNAAIREPLYVTGISHTLRNDGDYQFTVTTRTATDIMVQRFAQLLNFGK